MSGIGPGSPTMAARNPPTEPARLCGCAPGRTHAMSGNFRSEAIQAIAAAKHQLNRVNFKEVHLKDLFGANVFNEEVQRQRLPKPVYKALQKTIKQGAVLDPAIADNVATAMKD